MWGVTASLDTPCPPSRGLDRRGFGAVVLAAVGTGLGATTLTSCASGGDEDAPDALLPLAEAAARDAAELAAAGDGRPREEAARLQRVAGARRVHAETLRAEIARLAPSSSGSPATGTPAPAGAGGTPAAGAVTCPPLAEVRDRLRRDAELARGVATRATGYRSSLAASVSAACTSAAEVVLG